MPKLPLLGLFQNVLINNGISIVLQNDTKNMKNVLIAFRHTMQVIFMFLQRGGALVKTRHFYENRCGCKGGTLVKILRSHKHC